MTSFMALEGVTLFLRLKDVTITCKRMRRSLSIGGSSSVQWRKRTSDGGNGNHSVSLPIILIKIKVDQMLPSSYISSLLVSIL